MLSSDVNSDLHLSRMHYRPLVSGNAAYVLGAPEHLRLVSIVIGAMRDGCDGCVSDTLDAIALDVEAMGAAHRVEAGLSGGVIVPYGSDEAREIMIRLAKMPFPIRRKMADLSVKKLKASLDGTPPPEAII